MTLQMKPVEHEWRDTRQPAVEWVVVILIAGNLETVCNLSRII